MSGAVTPYDRATARSTSASSGKGRLRFWAQRSWLSTSWGEIPSRTASRPSNTENSSRYEHIWRVHPGVSSPG